MGNDHNNRGRGDDDHESGYQGGERWQQDQADQARRAGYGEQGGRQQRSESFSRDFSQGGQHGSWEGSQNTRGEGKDHPDRWNREEMRDRQRAFANRTGNEPNAYGARDEWANRSGHSGQDHGYRGHEESGRWPSGRAYGGGDRGRSEGGRDFWDKATDEVSSWFGDDDAKRRRNADEHRGRGPKSYSRSDDRIKEDINDRLTEDGALDATDIDVEVSNREVTLTGEVDSRNSKRRAEDIAESVSGVSHVQNNLRVKQTDQIRPVGSSTTSTADVARSTTSRNRL